MIASVWLPMTPALYSNEASHFGKMRLRRRLFSNKPLLARVIYREAGRSTR
jgi:hypothetical protein